MEFGKSSVDYNKVLENWNTYFCVRCREEYSFFYLAHDSLHCAEEMIESIHASNHATIYNGSAQKKTPHIVPESPTSTSAARESTHE